MKNNSQEYDIKGIISRSPWFEGLPEEAHAQLADASRIRSYRKNSYLYTVGETSSDTYCILSGRVRMLLSSAIGQEYAINDLEPEEWLGEQFLTAAMPTLLDARIVENTTVLVVPRAAVLAAADQYPLTYKNLLIQNQMRTRGMLTLLLGMAFYPLRSRLAGWFLALIEEHGQPAENGVYLDVQLSQNDFAQFSLGSRQRINKIIGEWREQGVIALESNRYLIRDPAALQAEMELKDHDA